MICDTVKISVPPGASYLQVYLTALSHRKTINLDIVSHFPVCETASQNQLGAKSNHLPHNRSFLANNFFATLYQPKMPIYRTTDGAFVVSDALIEDAASTCEKRKDEEYPRNEPALHPSKLLFI